MEQRPSSNTNGHSDEQQNSPLITELPNFNFNSNSCTTFTHFQNEPFDWLVAFLLELLQAVVFVAV